MLEFPKKEKWFKEYWISVSKPKHAGVRNPNKQENSIQYRTYYRNEYNGEKNKRRIIYRSNTGHVGYKKNARHDNPNNVVTFKQTSNNHENNKSKEIRDTLAEVLTSINRRTSSTIFPETQHNDRMNSF